jgi:hypothetical protein
LLCECTTEYIERAGLIGKNASLNVAIALVKVTRLVIPFVSARDLQLHGHRKKREAVIQLSAKGFMQPPPLSFSSSFSFFCSSPDLAAAVKKPKLQHIMPVRRTNLHNGGGDSRKSGQFFIIIFLQAHGQSIMDKKRRCTRFNFKKRADFYCSVRLVLVATTFNKKWDFIFDRQRDGLMAFY